jgi:putative transposase
MSISCAMPWTIVPRKVDDDCLQELRWLYARRDLAEALNDLATWLAR